MTNIKHPAISFSLVFFQFALIAVLLLMLPLSFNYMVLSVQAVAIFIGLWAVQTMHLGHFNIIPDPMPDIEIVTHGPYRYIRHPMYFSIVLFFFPIVLIQIDWIALAVYTSLCFILFIKLSYEENLLVDTLPDYAEYQKKTKKIIPFVL